MMVSSAHYSQPEGLSHNSTRTLPIGHWIGGGSRLLKSGQFHLAAATIIFEPAEYTGKSEALQ